MKRLFATVSIAITTLWACKPDEKTILEPLHQNGYAELISAYRSNAIIVKAEAEDGSTRFRLNDETEFVLEGLEIDDCTEKDPQVVTHDFKGNISVGGKNTGIILRKGASHEESIAVYMFKTPSIVKVFLTNGENITIQHKPVREDPRIPIIEDYPEYGKVTLPALYLDVPVSNYWMQTGWWSSEENRWIDAKQEYITGTLKIVDSDHVYWDTPEFEAVAKFRGRGNSTWDMAKKPYKIKFDSKEEIFGLSKDKEWCILANYADKTLIRNLTAMEISRQLGFSWTPRMRSVNVYMNGTYQGVYSFAEHKKVSSDRVDIDLKAGDLYFEIESNQDETVCWWTDLGVPMMFSEPAEPAADVIAYAKKYYADFEAALKSKGDYAKYIDMDSFVDYYIIQELTKNIDGNLRKSTFLTLAKDGKLKMYHVWDFDLTMGNCNYYENSGLNAGHGNEPTGWWIRDRGANGIGQGWYCYMFQDPVFKEELVKRWKQVYPALKANIPAFIQQQSALLTDSGAQQQNFKTWKILNTYVWPNWKVTGTYKGEVKVLQDFYETRLKWINDNIEKF